MILFYQGTGSSEIQIVDDCFPLSHWQALKAKVVEHLHTMGSSPAAQFLESKDFEFKRGTNNFGDDFCVLYKVLPMEKYTEAVGQSGDAKIKENAALVATMLGSFTQEHVRFVAIDYDRSLGPAVVSSPVLKITSATVERALNDAERLVPTEGPTSAVDRAHTALHGYLRALADQAGIAYTDNASGSITEMFKLVRTKHPKLISAGPAQEFIEKILKTHAVVVDALQPLRNRSSVAHPNEELLEAPEAMLVINSVRCLLHYLNSRTGL